MVIDDAIGLGKGLTGQVGGVAGFLLDADQNGVQQITEHFRDKKDFTAVHIVSHGASGILRLGNSHLHLQSNL